MEKKRSNSVITTRQEGSALIFTVLGVGDLTLNIAELSAGVQERAIVHGMKQRISDAAALSCDPYTGKPATAQEKFDSMRALVDYYMSGAEDWYVARTAGGGTGRTSNVLQAIANVYGLDVAGARGYVEKYAARKGIEYTKSLAVWRSSDKITAELARMAASVPARVNADDLIDEME